MDWLWTAKQLPGRHRQVNAAALRTVQALRNLGACIRDAGMLCESFYLGVLHKHCEVNRYGDPWQPGCGRPA